MNITEITTLQQRAIQLLLAESTVSAAARQLGIDRTTIYAWRKSDPAFTTHLDQARSIQAQITADSLQDLASTAIETIREILLSQSTPPAIRLRAAQAVLKMGQPAAEPETLQQNSTQIDIFDNSRTGVETTAVPKTGRNDPCSCNSRLKFKSCCGNSLRQPTHPAAEAA